MCNSQPLASWLAIIVQPISYYIMHATTARTGYEILVSILPHYILTPTPPIKFLKSSIKGGVPLVIRDLDMMFLECIWNLCGMHMVRDVDPVVNSMVLHYTATAYDRQY